MSEQTSAVSGKTKQNSNPNWTRDELILALDLYFREPDAYKKTDHPEVIKLSKILNKLNLHGRSGTETIRNVNGVTMKLSNLARFDPNYSGVGLKQGAKLDEIVWNEFSSDIVRLRNTAIAILAGAKEIENYSDDDDDAWAKEGRILARWHKKRERDQRIVKRKKAQVKKETGKLVCEICNFDFFATYGELGEDFAECHHAQSLSSMKPDDITTLADLHILCANCHRMIHRRSGLTVDELRDIYISHAS